MPEISHVRIAVPEQGVLNRILREGGAQLFPQWLYAEPGAEPLLAGFQPVKPDEAEPAHRVAKGRLPPSTDPLHARSVPGAVIRHHRLIHQRGGRKIRVGAVLGAMRTYVAMPSLTGLRSAGRPVAGAPSSATAMGPSPKRARQAAT